MIRYLIFLACQISWVAVPIFFVLSGYLITGILYDTRNRAGYFRTFYRRRAVRILPLYYVILAIYALLYWATHSKSYPQQLLFLVYLENWSQNLSIWGNKYFSLGHLWSLAVEEQFYLVWPVVVWMVRDRRKLLAICYSVVIACFILRLCWPFFHSAILVAYFSTFTRADGLMLGAALALHRRDEAFNTRWLGKPAAWTLSLSVAVFYAIVWIHGNGLPNDMFGVYWLYPLINLMALAIIALCLSPGGRVQALCQRKAACFLGSMSYSLYLVHQMVLPYILLYVHPYLVPRVGHPAARMIVLLGAGAMTYVLGRACYLVFEVPALRWKEHFRYGPASVEENYWLQRLIAKARQHFNPQEPSTDPFVERVAAVAATSKTEAA